MKKELITELLTRENVAEIIRSLESMKHKYMFNTYELTEKGEVIKERKDIPETVKEYNKELMLLDEEILKILFKIKTELKKQKK